MPDDVRHAINVEEEVSQDMPHDLNREEALMNSLQNLAHSLDSKLQTRSPKDG